MSQLACYQITMYVVELQSFTCPLFLKLDLYAISICRSINFIDEIDALATRY